MSDWHREGFVVPAHLRGYRAKLLPVQVTLAATEWYTQTQPRGMSLQKVIGQDVDGEVYLVKELQDRVEQLQDIEFYRIARRALQDTKQAVKGSRYEHGLPRQNFYDGYNDVYDVCISFLTNKEAVLFRMLVAGTI